jgi:hypothetical protein
MVAARHSAAAFFELYISFRNFTTKTKESQQLFNILQHTGESQKKR